MGSMGSGSGWTDGEWVLEGGRPGCWPIGGARLSERLAESRCRWQDGVRIEMAHMM